MVINFWVNKYINKWVHSQNSIRIKNSYLGLYKFYKIATKYEKIKEGIHWEKLDVLHRENLF
jgi:hypothetical protein